MILIDIWPCPLTDDGVPDCPERQTADRRVTGHTKQVPGTGSPVKIEPGFG